MNNEGKKFDEITTSLFSFFQGKVTRKDGGSSPCEDDPVVIFLLCPHKMANGAANDRRAETVSERAGCVHASCLLARMWPM